MASAWPAAKGSIARQTAVRRRSCIPSATANSQPIPGLMPWKAPSATSAIQDQSIVIVSVISVASRVAVGVRGGIAALQAYLVRPHLSDFREKAAVYHQPTVLGGVELRYPPANPIRIELLVPRAVQ